MGIEGCGTANGRTTDCLDTGEAVQEVSLEAKGGAVKRQPPYLWAAAFCRKATRFVPRRRA